MGFSHPLPPKLITGFLKECQKVLVVEEGEPYMEEAVKAMAQEEGLVLPINGKKEGLFTRLYEYNPAQVKQCIATYFDLPYTPPEVPDLSDLPPVPQRPPTLCAGCSHRATYHEVKKATEGMDTIFPSDIGCYTLGLLPPLSSADYLICMGSSAGTSGGFSQVNPDKKVIAFIGDSTFFHSGIPGLINGVYNNHNFTLVILDNGTTAMTGHQPHPGVDMERINMQGYGRVSIEKVVRAIGVEHVIQDAAATIPLCLSEYWEQGKLRKGQRLVMTAFGLTKWKRAERFPSWMREIWRRFEMSWAIRIASPVRLLAYSRRSSGSSSSPSVSAST